MTVTVHFYSYLKTLTECAQSSETVPAGTSVRDLHKQVMARFPRLGPMEKSTLIAVGVDYQPPTYVLKEGEEVSFFPPVQGG